MAEPGKMAICGVSGEHSAMGARGKMGAKTSEQAKRRVVEQQMGRGPQHQRQRGGDVVGRSVRYSQVHGRVLGHTLYLRCPFSSSCPRLLKSSPTSPTKAEILSVLLRIMLWK